MCSTPDGINAGGRLLLIPHPVTRSVVCSTPDGINAGVSLPTQVRSPRQPWPSAQRLPASTLGSGGTPAPGATGQGQCSTPDGINAGVSDYQGLRAVIVLLE